MREIKIAEFSRRKQEIQSRAEEALRGTGVPYSARSPEDKPINLVFVGQYSAGKSTIIRMLTGRNDIAVGAGITTEQTATYEWNGMLITDTPGIHTEQRPDHDEISYKAIAAADVLVFVVTSQMFDANIAAHFRKLAIENDKAGEMLLVVNKMNKTAEGNTPHQREVIRGDIAKVIAPYTPEDMRLCFLDAKSCLDGMEKAASSPERAQRLIERSGCDAFIEALNRFVEEKGLASRLTTELYIAEDALQKALGGLERSFENSDVGALEENYLQQRYLLADARNSLRRDVQNVFYNTACKIRETGLDAARIIAEARDREALEKQLDEKIDETNAAANDCQAQAQRMLAEGLARVERGIADIEQSPFTMKLKSRLEGHYGELPDSIRELLLGAGGIMKSMSEMLLEGAAASEATNALVLAGYKGSDVRQAVLDLGNAFNYKFKPWQAEKLARRVNKIGVAMSVAAVFLDAAMQIKDDFDAQARSMELKKYQQDIRSEFNGFAGELTDFGRSFLEAQLDAALGQYIAELDSKLEAIRAASTAKSEKAKELEGILRDCRALIEEIHKERL